MILYPCLRDCPGRFPGCHGKCERYAEYRAEIEAMNAEKRREYVVAGYSFETVTKIRDMYPHNKVKKNFIGNWRLSKK